jgi:hypothetical protein
MHKNAGPSEGQLLGANLVVFTILMHFVNTYIKIFIH